MTRLKISDLLPGTDYVVQVRAVRNGKRSRWSRKFNFTTIEENGIPEAPTTTWGTQGRAFFATWSPVTKDTGNKNVRIASYELELSLIHI